MKCKTCGKNSDGEYCFQHKVRKPLSSGKGLTRVVFISKKTKMLSISNKKSNIVQNNKQTELLHKKMFEWWKSFGSKKYCQSCNVLLPNFFSTINVHHLLPKHKFVDVKLDEKYWMLLCEKCHCSWELSPSNKNIEERTKKAKNNYENN